MAILVQKFGGTSVADAACIKRAAARVIAAKERGYQVVVTVSAPAGMTDKLIKMAKEITPDPDPRELDVLVSTGEQWSIALMCMTLHALGHPAISLTGGQVGILTDSAYTKARIQKIETQTIRRELDKGKIVVVAGFQGIDPELNITTLGRGSSDLTAVALAAALRAELCEIYTDVDGIYTADPRVVPDSSKLDAVSHDEILELASVGAKVIQSRSVEVAKKFHVPLCVRSTFTQDPGTILCSRVTGFETVAACGCALSVNESRITIAAVPDRPGIAAHILGGIAGRNVNIDMIIQSFPHEGKADMSFLVKNTDLKPALAACEQLVEELGAESLSWEEEIARVSIVGRGMISQKGVAARMCSALGEHGINIQMITTSEINFSAVVHRQDGERALRAVHEKFRLTELPKAAPVADEPTELRLSESDTMEGLHVQSVDCDLDQAELTLTGVADRPGQAARLFETLSNAGINLDVILQNSGRSGLADISFTIRRADLARAKTAIESMSPPITDEPVGLAADIAKVMITGVGLRSHAGAASRVFGVLARDGINIEMIGTSEVKISVIVPEADSARAVAALRTEFKLSA